MHKFLKWLVSASLCLAQGVAAADKPSHVVDHLVIGVNNLEFGMAQLKALTGVEPIIGGVHPHLGTRNALISLGEDSYLEILAPNPAADPASINDMGKAYLALIEPLDKIAPVLWAMGSTDLEATREMLAAKDVVISEPVPGSRRKPDGSLLQWRTSEVESFSSPATPFLIQWAEGDSPALTTPKGCTLSRFTLAADAKLRGMLAAVEVPVEIAEQGAVPISVELSCPTGLVHLP